MNLGEIVDLYDFSGHTVVVTGGAGVLGSEMACALVGCGANVAILDRDPALAERVIQRIERLERPAIRDDSFCIGRAAVVHCDVLQRDSLVRAQAAIVGEFGGIYGLINAAGGNRPTATTSPDLTFFDLPESALHAVLDLNLLGTILPSQVFGQTMAEAGEGVILNVSSMNAFRPLTRTPAYSAAKAGVSNFTQWLAVHMAQNCSPRIRVNAIAPGFFLTQQNRYLLTDQESGELTQRGRTILQHTPLGRFGAPDDLLGTVLWLLSPASAFVTGITVPVDGRLFRLRRGLTRGRSMVLGRGSEDSYLTKDEAGAIVSSASASLAIDGSRVLMVIPDGTRTMPMPMMFGLFEDCLVSHVATLDYLVALGTHQPMTDEHLSKLVGRPVVNGLAGESHIFKHKWADPATFRTIGEIPAAEISRFSGGFFAQDVPVTLNKLIFDYDRLIICGPVFPHEVVGFSGGNKYFFPGIGGPEIINFTHWLGAVMTSNEIIGSGYTPVRAVIDRAAAFIDLPVACFSLVVTHAGLHGLYFGTAQEAWQAASALSSQVHITWRDQPVQRVLSIMPALYDDLWTAAKGMYKTEPAVADGGEVVIYAPHIDEVSYTHGPVIDVVSYHCRDYFLKQWDRFKDYPWGVLAHSAHVKGLGTYDSDTGIEATRIVRGWRQASRASAVSESTSAISILRA